MITKALRLGKVILLLAALTSVAAADKPSFDHYAVILDRQPFGTGMDASGAGAGGVPGQPPAESFAATLQLSGIIESAAALRVAFNDTKAQKSYLLDVGESEDGIEVVDANYKEEKALLRKGQEEVWLSLKGGTATAAGSAASPSAATPAPMPGLTSGRRTSSATSAAAIAAARPPLSFGPLPPNIASSAAASSRVVRLAQMLASSNRTGGAISYAARRMALRDALIQEDPAYKPPEGEALQQHLQNYQVEAIRQGLPALPIQLTPEQDAQLVKEGVLPPIEDVQPPPGQ